MGCSLRDNGVVCRHWEGGGRINAMGLIYVKNTLQLISRVTRYHGSSFKIFTRHGSNIPHMVGKKFSSVDLRIH
jgi:hypothetical protein